MKPTKQQEAILSHSVARGEILLLNAYAGTGKTTTLRMFAKANPQLKFLYLSFNRDNAREATASFPRNCVCKTIHSLAYAQVGRHYSRADEVRSREVKDAFNLAAPYIAIYVIDTLKNFLYSTDHEISSRHLIDIPTRVSEKQILAVARKLWKRMQDMEDDEIPMSHDGYLKLWSFQEPAIANYDIIFLDEAQDTNPVALQIVLNQVEHGRAGLVLAGDTHQAIYAWRKATDAMILLRERATYSAPLTESFRFGAGIANDASLLLNHLKKDSVQLKGRGDSSGRPQNFAVLARSNARLIDQAIRKAQENKSIHFAGTSEQENWDPWQKYKFQMTLDVYYLWAEEPQKVKDRYMKRFRSFAEVVEHTEGEGAEHHGKDLELALQVTLVKEYEDELPTLLEMLRSRSCGPESATLTFSTAHRSKGMQWDAVQLLDDFLDPGNVELLDELPDEVRIEESNIVYVAITRAVKKLKLPEYLDRWFDEQAPNRTRNHCLEPESGLEPLRRIIAAKSLKKETSSQSENVRKVRRIYGRAYEPWDDQEDQLLRQALRFSRDIDELGKVFQRQPAAIKSRIEKLS